MEATSPSHGFLGSLHGFADSFLATAGDRLKLFAVELQEEKLRLIQVLILALAAVFAGVMALTFISLTVAFAFWETARVAALSGIAAFYAIGLLALVVSLRRLLTKHPPPFNATIRGLREDRACIRPQS